jgi:hypothetical protein
VIAIAVCQWSHGLQVGLRQRGLRVMQGRRDSGNPLDLGLGELLEVGLTVEGTISNEIGGAVGGLQLGNVLLDDPAELLRITAITAQGFHQHGNASLVLDNQL